MKFINLAIIRLAGSLTAGIVVAYFSSEVYTVITSASQFFIILGTILLVLFLVWFWERNKLRQGILFGILTYLSFFVIGFANYQLHRPAYQKQHYSLVHSPPGAHLIQLKITEVLSENQFNHRYEAQVLQLDSQQVKGKILFSVKKDSAALDFVVDTKLLVSGALSEISEPMNPHQFNYKKYLENQGIYHQLKTSSAYIISANKGSPTLRGLSEQLRTHIIGKLNKTSIQPKQRAVLQALVLGHKKDIDKEQYRAFAAAGALHILAVSGLHVGILFLVFSVAFTPAIYEIRQANSIYLGCFTIMGLCDTSGPISIGSSGGYYVFIFCLGGNVKATYQWIQHFIPFVFLLAFI